MGRDSAKMRRVWASVRLSECEAMSESRPAAMVLPVMCQASRPTTMSDDARIAWYREMAEELGWHAASTIFMGCDPTKNALFVSHAAKRARFAAHFGRLALGGPRGGTLLKDMDDFETESEARNARCDAHLKAAEASRDRLRFEDAYRRRPIVRG